NWWPKTKTVQFQGPPKLKAAFEEPVSKAISEWKPAATSAVLPVPVRSSSKDTTSKRVFVVHGHDQPAREQLELVLHRLGLEPFVLANTGGGGLTLIEALERELSVPATRPHFGIVLMTPDDMGYSRTDGEVGRQPRARQNVVLEMGMLLIALK